MRLNVGSGNTLSLEIAGAKDIIDGKAADARARYITTGAGQESTYQAKAVDAQAYKDAGYPMPCDAAVYPWIAAEAAGTGKTPTVTADGILAARDFWIQKGAQIESVRVGCKGRIATKTTSAAVSRELGAGVATLDSL